MKKAMFVLIAALILVLLPGPTFVADEDDDFQDLAEEIQEACDSEEVVEVMQEAAEEAGVSIDTEGVLIASRHSTSGSLSMFVVSATIEGLQNVPAIELEDGVDVGFMFFNGVSTDLDPDFYTVRLVALEPVVVGEIAGEVQFINPQDEVVFVDATIIDIEFLDPEPPEIVIIDLKIVTDVITGKTTLEVTKRCSNGYTWTEEWSIGC